MNKTIIYCYPFIKDIEAEKTYYCSPDDILIVNDMLKCYINPYGKASINYDSENGVVFPIKKVGNEILLLVSNILISQSHSSELENINSWIEIDIKKLFIKIIHSDDEIDRAKISYAQMGLLELKNVLSDWLDVIIEKDAESINENRDIAEIIKLLKRKIKTSKNKQDLLNLHSNFKVSLEDYENTPAESILKELMKLCKQKLLKFDESKVENKKDFSTFSIEDLEAIVKSIKSSDEDIIAAEQELRNRAQKK